MGTDDKNITKGGIYTVEEAIDLLNKQHLDMQTRLQQTRLQQARQEETILREDIESRIDELTSHIALLLNDLNRFHQRQKTMNDISVLMHIKKQASYIEYFTSQAIGVSMLFDDEV